MKQNYLSPEAEIILWNEEVFLRASGETFEDEPDNLFDWTWGE